MLIAILIIVLLAEVYNLNLNRKTIMKLTDLAATLATLDTTVNNIKTSVDTLKAALADVDLPPDVQSALDKLTADVGTLSADVPAAPAPAP